MCLKHLRHFTCGHWQLKILSDICPRYNLHTTPEISVPMRYIINSHSEDSLVCVNRDWKLSWTTLSLLCFNYYMTRMPVISLTQVFHMVSVVLVIETWDRDGASSLNWNSTHCNNFTVNSCQNNNRHLSCSDAFKCIVYINISYRLVSWILLKHNIKI